MEETRELPGTASLHGPAMLDVEIASLGGSPTELLDAVRRNVEQTAALMRRLTGAAFRCGCYVTLGCPGDPQAHWRIMAWDNARCGSPAHRALKAKWEGSNLS